MYFAFECQTIKISCISLSINQNQEGTNRPIRARYTDSKVIADQNLLHLTDTRSRHWREKMLLLKTAIKIKVAVYNQTDVYVVEDVNVVMEERVGRRGRKKG